MRHKTRGEEAWVEVTWDEALGHIAERMQKIKAEHGPERWRSSATASAVRSSSTR